MSMKLDLNLVQKLLEIIEEMEPGENEYEPIDRTEEYHLYLMLSNGIIDSGRYQIIRDEISTYNNISITNEGKEFLSALQNKSVWNKAQQNIQIKGGNLNQLPLDMLKRYLIKNYKNWLGL